MNIIEVSTLPPCVADRGMIRQVFAYLIDDAVRYIDVKQQGIVKITGEIKGATTVYCVEDNGISITRQYQKMFDRQDRWGSTGRVLGFTILSKILEKNNGSLRFDTEHGAGHRACVSLPAV